MGADRDSRFERYAALTHGVPAPFALVDLDAFDRNADALVARAAGTPIRLASKSVRCRALIERALARPGFAGVLAYHLDEALWLAAQLPGAAGDILVAYPSVDRAALVRLATDPAALGRIAVMIDAPEHLALLESVVAQVGAESGSSDRPRIGVWLDIDCSLRVGPIHIGARRSPLHTPRQAVAAARAIARSEAVQLRGVMFYDAQIAGVPDASPVVHAMQRASAVELRRRRRAVLDAIRAVVPVPAVNAGGTGSLHLMGADPLVTELAAGSGHFGPALFDGYRAFTPESAAFYALDVVRHPAPGYVTAYSGGYAASGAAGPSRLPTPCWPPGLSLVAAEGAGEVQTPLRVARGHARPPIGSRVWLRHAKAGEMLERFAHVHLVSAVGGGTLVERVPSYRGEGRCFG